MIQHKFVSKFSTKASLFSFLIVFVCLLLPLGANSQNERAQNEGGGPDGLAALHFRFVGPEGNRVSAIIGEPGNPNVIYIGAADGGIWKTDDGGTTWKPIFDHENAAAIGALAMAPSAHNVIYAGTGEPWLIRPYYAMGDGVYKSTDAGRSWQHIGLEKTGHIARIVVDPHNPDRAFTCAIGEAFRPQHERGIFRTTDGGKTWQQVLFVNENTGCSELAMDPADPNTLFAGMWQVAIHRWDLDSGGTSSGVYVSRDGGNTWNKISGHGLPAADHPIGKVAVAIAANNPERVYALMQDTTPGLYRSDDGGKNWTLVNQTHVTDERAPYYTRFAVSPDDENLLYFVCVSFSMSRDGGNTVFIPSFGPGGFGLQGARTGPPPATGVGSAGGDNHDIWIDPTNANRILVANDAGVSISNNRGATYQRFVLPISQVYHVATDNDIPYHVMGNLQDRSSFRGPSRILSGGFFGGGFSLGYITGTGGCEDGYSVPDPTDANIVWSGCDNGRMYRMDFRTGMARDVTAWPITSYGWPPAKMKYRWDWVTPIAISPHDHNRVYIGAQKVFMTTNGGQSWKVISPDLTANNPAHEQNSGGITPDDLVTFDGATIYSIAESPVKAGVIWTGSDDGQVNVTQDGGLHWTNVTKNIPDLPAWGTVWNVEPSHFDAGRCYITVNLQHVGIYDARAYETSDYGASWKLITASVPKSMNSSAHWIAEDPVRKGMLYLGVDNGLYVSWDDGEHWTRLRNNFPPAPVYTVKIQRKFNDLVLGTYGRGVYILDDITPLRNWDKAQGQDFYLFKPRAAYRFRNRDDAREADVGSHVTGDNAPYGADINFRLAAPVKDMQITITSGNETIRTLKVQGHAGLNRVWWDLRYEPGSPILMQTTPPDAPWAEVHRHYAAYGTRIPPPGPVVPPGNYMVHVKAGSHEGSAALTVLPDPHSSGTEQSIRAQVQFAREVMGEEDEAADMINHLEWTRRQDEDLITMLTASGKPAGAEAAGENANRYSAAISAAKDFEKKAVALEGELIDVRNTGRSEDAFREPVQLYERISWMIGDVVGTPGSGSGGGDLAPTEQQIAVNDEFKQQLAQIQAQFKRFLQTETPAFNSTLKKEHVAAAIEP
ncbi:MAG TPA: hypothetical protein VKS20_02630 [Candidatus Acidoferrales bacterium]|nr:hypothetical protein [Candidatus Acidoferrales bacterium]